MHDQERTLIRYVSCPLMGIWRGTVTDEVDPLTTLGLEAIDLRWTLKDIAARRWMLCPVDPEHLSKLVGLGLVEMRDDTPVVTSAGQELAWRPD